MKGYKLPAQLDRDIDKLDVLIKGFLKGTADPLTLKAFRVPCGVYEQRKEGSYMVRIRCAGGFITPLQLEKICFLAEKYGKKEIHLTTRQEIQIHDVALEDVVPVIRELKTAGLSSRGGGGNTVRNIMVSPESGTEIDEVFDVLPFCIALTSRFLEEDDSWNLPRKLKLSFSSTPADKGYATINDLGFIASEKEGVRGFRVYIAGGMGRKARPGILLFDFLPLKELYNVARAVKELFFKHGNRKNRNTARLRFLLDKLGQEEFIKLFHEEYRIVKSAGYSPLEIQEFSSNSIDGDGLSNYSFDTESHSFRSYGEWKSGYAEAQKQEGFFRILLPVLKGDIPVDHGYRIAAFFRLFGENTIRVTQEQNLLFVNIPEDYLQKVYRFFASTLSGESYLLSAASVVACAGASTCKLGICIAKNAVRPIARLLSEEGIDPSLLRSLKIRISGCPNSCGQHPIGDLGFFGGAFRNQEHLYPGYHVVAGGVTGDGKTELAEKAGKISARDLPNFLYDVVKDFSGCEKKSAGFKEYLASRGNLYIASLLEGKYSGIPSFDEDKNYYFDWGGEELFSLTRQGKGECSAGMFDFIERDLKLVEELKGKLAAASTDEESRILLYEILIASSRMLLVTRGLESSSVEKVLKNFQEHFIATGLIGKEFSPLMEKALESTEVLKDRASILLLAEAVVALFNSMDDNLNFNTLNEEKEEQAPAAALIKDLRGVACPMNFVKTKLELSRIKNGEILEILLDDGAPIDNVPGSVKAEGHEVLRQERQENHWKVVIKKGA